MSCAILRRAGDTKPAALIETESVAEAADSPLLRVLLVEDRKLVYHEVDPSPVMFMSCPFGMGGA